MGLFSVEGSGGQEAFWFFFLAHPFIWGGFFWVLVGNEETGSFVQRWKRKKASVDVFISFVKRLIFFEMFNCENDKPRVG